MKTAIIVGSTRDEAQSLKVGRFFEERLSQVLTDSSALLVDLNKIEIPLDPDGTSKEWDEVKRQLEAMESYIVITPEWHGMATPGIKNFFIHIGQAMSHKPTLLVSVSAGRGGAYPIAELRMSSYKNKRPLYLPDHMIFRNVKEVLNKEPDPDSKSDQFYREYADYLLKLLGEYTKAIRAVHDSGVIDLENFKNGM